MGSRSACGAQMTTPACGYPLWVRDVWLAMAPTTPACGHPFWKKGNEVLLTCSFLRHGRRLPCGGTFPLPLEGVAAGRGRRTRATRSLLCQFPRVPQGGVGGHEQHATPFATFGVPEGRGRRVKRQQGGTPPARVPAGRGRPEPRNTG